MDFYGFYTCCIYPKQITSGGAHFRDTAQRQHSSCVDVEEVASLFLHWIWTLRHSAPEARH